MKMISLVLFSLVAHAQCNMNNNNNPMQWQQPGGNPAWKNYNNNNDKEWSSSYNPHREGWKQGQPQKQRGEFYYDADKLDTCRTNAGPDKIFKRDNFVQTISSSLKSWVDGTQSQEDLTKLLACYVNEDIRKWRSCHDKDDAEKMQLSCTGRDDAVEYVQYNQLVAECNAKVDYVAKRLKELWAGGKGLVFKSETSIKTRYWDEVTSLVFPLMFREGEKLLNQYDDLEHPKGGWLLGLTYGARDEFFYGHIQYRSTFSRMNPKWRGFGVGDMPDYFLTKLSIVCHDQFPKMQKRTCEERNRLRFQNNCADDAPLVPPAKKGRGVEDDDALNGRLARILTELETIEEDDYLDDYPEEDDSPWN